MESSWKFSLLLTIFCFCLVITLPAQIVIQYEEEQGPAIQLTDSITFPSEIPGYTLVVPEREVSGLIVFFNSDRDTINKIWKHANPLGLGVMYLSTGNRLDFLFEEQAFLQVEGYIHKVVQKYKIPQDNLLLTGMSIAGTRALKFAVFCNQEKGKTKIKPKAVAACDSPIDFIRFWNACVRAAKINESAVAANEGNWVSKHLERNLRFTPIENPTAYVEFSPYSFSAPDGGNAVYLKHTAIRLYTEPDVKWWIDNRAKSYYGMNSIDAAALINELSVQGNKNAELVLTQDKGYRPDGLRHPHSWSIVDEKELVDWFYSLLK